MSLQPFQIATDPSRRLITITFSTLFWSLDIARSFRTEVVSATAALQCRPGDHLVLVDLRNAVIQSQEIYQRMQSLIGSATAARIALVASSPLARMQTKRLQVRENIVMFKEMDEAHAWLLASADT
jgi:hypothetical protein